MKGAAVGTAVRGGGPKGPRPAAHEGTSDDGREAAAPRYSKAKSSPEPRMRSR